MTRDNYLGDYGTQIILNTGEDLTQSGIEKVEIIAKKPSGKIVTWPGSVFDTTNILYETKPADFDENGTWIVQSSIEAVTWVGKGRTAAFRVKRCLQT